MAWRVAKVEEHRKEFIEQVLIGDRTVTDLCNEYQISRKTGYKWISRYNELGDDGLKDRSKAPHARPGRTDERLVHKVLEVKSRYPAWGPKKVLALLGMHYPDEDWPSDTTIGNILYKHGLVAPRRCRKRIPAKTDPLSHCTAPNDVWSIDFKGWFLTKDQIKCDPLTICDAHTRFILHCSKLHSGKELDVWKALEELFHKNGLPKYLRHDNGPPFATAGAGRLSRLSVKLIKAGVIPEWIEPGKPCQNGRHERMHGILKNEGVFPLQLTLEEQQMKFMNFVHYYNFERPHEALEQKFPGNVYVPSNRIWDGNFRSPEYDSAYLVKRVRGRGLIMWNGIDIYIGKTLQNEYVGLKEDENGYLAVYFGPIFLGTIDHEGILRTPRKNNRPKLGYKTRCY
jgi:transposase InsO family protein